MHCNTLQHTATRGNTLQHAATHCSTLQHLALKGENNLIRKSNALQHTATHCNTLQQTATDCNTLQHLALKGESNLIRKSACGCCLILPFLHRVLLEYVAVCCYIVLMRYDNILTPCSVAVCCSALQHVLQCVAVCRQHAGTLQHTATHCNTLHAYQCVAVCCSVLQCVAACCNVLQAHCAPQHAATHCSILQHMYMCAGE